MHRYVQTQENGLSQATRRTSPHFVRLWLTACLLLLTTATYLLTPGLALAQSAITSGSAPGGPGSTAVWSPSTNAILGTSATTASDVWFSGYNGIISEVYWPTADTPNTTDMQFMIGDSSHTWADEEKTATTSSTALYDPHSLAWTVTNTATNGKYKLAKTIYTDPARDPLGFQHPAAK